MRLSATILSFILCLKLQAATIVVSNNSDALVLGSLRSALASAAAGDIIVFSTGMTITLNSSLPVINFPLTINATTATGYVDRPVVSLRRGTAGVPIGFQFDAGANGSTIKGINFQNFSGVTPTPPIQAGIYINGANDLTIQGNTFGLDLTGNASGNQNMLGITSSTNATSGHIIGGSLLQERNVFVGGSYGIQLNNVTNALFVNNIFGLDFSGLTALTPFTSMRGIALINSQNCIIGRQGISERNIISNCNTGMILTNCNNISITNNIIGSDINGMSSNANFKHYIALELNGSNNNTIGGNQNTEGNLLGTRPYTFPICMNISNSSGNRIYGNLIGVLKDGTTSSLNSGTGINITGTSIDNIIGATTNNLGNIIAYQSTPITITGTGAYHNKIRGNSIYCNGAVIDFGFAGNEGNVNYASGTINPLSTEQEIFGTAQAQDTIDIYSKSSVCATGPANQGRVFLGTTYANTAGDWVYKGSFIAGDTVLVIATNYNSSRFSNFVRLQACPVTTVSAGTNYPETCLRGTINLNALAPNASQTGLWTSLDPLVTFADSSSYNTQASNFSTKSTVLIWELKSTTMPCYYRDTVTIIANSCENLTIRTYNVITPDADSKHDYLEIENINDYPDNKVIIYNRWGDLVYEAKGYDNDTVKFDGTSNTGKKEKQLPDGFYYYLVQLGDDDKNNTKGFLLIRR